jgi:hypothetical protein
MVREAIRYDQSLNWQWDGPEYLLFNNLSSDVARMISSNERIKRPTSGEARTNFQRITSIRREAWQAEIKQIQQLNP